MAREHDEEKAKAPEVVEREINLSLINAKLNELTNLTYKIAKKTEVDLEED